jgi:predicted short-subunit dehydrogenase-like oxidoreductase (DUF2520 family)
MIVGIVGAGRAGLGMGLALARAGYTVQVHSRSAPRFAVPPELTISQGRFPEWLRRAEVVLLAVPDDALGEVAAALVAGGWVGPSQVVLHLSGVHGREVLQALAPTGAALGSLHPLQSLSDPASAPERLRGALAAIEGDARAVGVASALAREVGLEPVALEAGAKARYHAAAVFASNFVVALAAVAERLFREAGLAEEAARRAVEALLGGTAANIRAAGPEAALTGPVARGDVETVKLHLAALEEPRARLYRLLSRAVLELARLEDSKRRALEEVLG